MYRRNDPRFRRTLNEISHTLETANETAQTRVFVFGREYVSPCLASIVSCFQPCAEHCFPNRDQRPRRGRRRSRGRAELNFDFYDDWDEDEDDALLGWGDDEYDGYDPTRGGYGSIEAQQPGTQQGMTYGSKRDGKGRRTPEAGADAGQGSSYLGFLRGLTGKLGSARGLRYKPSAAGLQEHPGSMKKRYDAEGEPLITDESDGDAVGRRKHRRKRSATAGSEQTLDSFSSRGDLFPSEDEDDAIPLDDEFAMVLERRTTSSGPDDNSSGIGGGNSERPSLGSRRSTRNRSQRSTPKSKRSSRAASHTSPADDDIDADAQALVYPTLSELKQEEELARVEEESAIAERRRSAQQLAEEQGLATDTEPVPIDMPAATTATAVLGTPSKPSKVANDDFGDFQDSPATPRIPSSNNEVEEAAFSPARLPRFS